MTDSARDADRSDREGADLFKYSHKDKGNHRPRKTEKHGGQSVEGEPGEDDPCYTDERGARGALRVKNKKCGYVGKTGLDSRNPADRRQQRLKVAEYECCGYHDPEKRECWGFVF